MRVLLAAMVCEKGELERNLAAHVELLAEAQDRGCDLAVFPEFSLTGSVDPIRHPERAVAIESSVVSTLVTATAEMGVGALFGIGERMGDDFFITQVYAHAGRVIGVQRKRHLGEGEEGFTTSDETARFALAERGFGVVICAESSVDFIWDAYADDGSVVFFCSAPGLYGRRTDEAGWRSGFDWWASAGLADARRNARRLGVWVGMVTQSGSTLDEDFPGIAALIGPNGEVADRTPDWKPDTLIINIPA